ncbi:MAG TPA: histidine kinase, partial [Anaerolineales bacterium]|nr:histidine kinase [Anaerolineales bacterium]
MSETVDYKSELDETQRALREITLMIEQSQGELSKLTQRNTAITSHLQQVQKQGAAMEEIKMAYDSALDAQQRLFVMRGQLEKLQNDKTHLEKYKSVLDQFVNDGNTTDVSGSAASSNNKGQMTGIEMIVNAQEAERQRLSRQMHDGPAQALSNFILQTEIAMRLLDVDSSQAKEELSNLKAAAMSTFQKVRGFIFEL